MAASIVDTGELATLLARCAGISVGAGDLTEQTSFEDLAVDSLAILSVVSEIERSHGVRMPVDTEKTATVGEFLDRVNSQLGEVA